MRYSTLWLASSMFVALLAGGASAEAGGTDSPEEPRRLTASDADAKDFFGKAVAVDGRTTVLGVPHDDVSDGDRGGKGAGAVYVFDDGVRTSEAQVKLTAPDAARSDEFGTSVAIDGDTIVVGAPDDANGDRNRPFEQGSAYVFEHTDGTWSYRTKLTARDAGGNDMFGVSVAIQKGKILIGATGDDVFDGSAYVFARRSGMWKQQQKLSAPETDDFGTSVAIDGETILIGAETSTLLGDEDTVRDNMTNVGTAHVFVREGNRWRLQRSLAPPNPEEYDFFGTSVDLDDDTAVIGAHRGDPNGTEDGGVVYVLRREGDRWREKQMLSAPTPAEREAFGSVVDLDANRLAVGAHHYEHEGPKAKETAYLFERTNGRWGLSNTLPPPRDSHLHVGADLALDATSALVLGASGADAKGLEHAGAAYRYPLDVLRDDDCPPDSSAAGNGFDDCRPDPFDSSPDAGLSGSDAGHSPPNGRPGPDPESARGDSSSNATASTDDSPSSSASPEPHLRWAQAEPPSSGCGCNTTGRTPTVAFALLLLGLAGCRRRTRVGESG